MTARIDISGQQFGEWTVLSHGGGRLWACRCSCGLEQDVDAGSLRAGSSTRCLRCRPPARLKHGGKRTRLYQIWLGMKARCENEHEPAYPRYGGRGITVSDAWRTEFEAFREWAESKGYDDGLTIDRIDNDKGYAPDNCRWATYAEQNRNSRRNRPVEFRGRTVLVCDLAIEVGLPQDILKNRILRYGWPIEQAVSTPVLPKGRRRPQ